MSAINGKTTMTVTDNLPERKRSYGTLEPQGENTDAKNPFLDPDIAAHWRLVYEKAQYECRHVFDPSLNWSEEEEKHLVRKLDWRICLWAVYFASLPLPKSRSLTPNSSVSCSLRFRLIEEILFRQFRIHF
jgi:hypothetical protein